MKFPSGVLWPIALICVCSSAALAADPKDDVLASLKAQNAAPAYRMKMTSTDTTTKAVTSVLVESVNPDGLHMKSESGGTTTMEIISDGKRTMMGHGGSELQEAPPAMAAMIGQARKSATMEAVVQGAKDVKMVGHEAVNGKPASVYTFTTEMMGLQSSNKLWISDADHLPLKSEGEAHGDMNGQKMDQKVTVTYEYDPSIKIVVPAAAK